ncbi:MAG: hypothetical protein [Bacteriophage sp.]|jgi:hypothetical protein|nr:MAG: hypothetical protein [Bacteriophage sp.]
MAKKKTITSELEPMQVGEKKDFPAVMCTTVKSMASTLGFKWDRVYKCASDREKRIVTVTRIK